MHVGGVAGGGEHLAGEHGALKLGDALGDLAFFVDDGRYPVVGAAQHVATGFQGAHTGQLQVLKRADGVSEPAIVADGYQHSGIPRIERHKIRVGHFIADVRHQPGIAGGQARLLARARGEAAHWQVKEADQAPQ